jgi:hypothetical protein
VLSLAPECAAQGWLFTSFRKNGETGVYFATSRDGRTWTPLREDRAWIMPEHEGMLMRDPFLAKGPDGTWHLLWTWGWTRKEGGGRLKIGHATSRDLVRWSRQEEIGVFESEPTARNVWAPEAAWDEARREWVIFWATTIPGRFADTEGTGDSGYNHRLYAMTTRDWKSFSAPRLWFDPGFNAIDATLARDGSRWVMVFKDERKNPLVKRLRLARGDSPAGPWREVSEPFTLDWVEGPSVARIGEEWWIYFDHYAKPHYYGAVKTKDWVSFEDVSRQVSFPADHRHGTVVALREEELRRLEAAAHR